MGRVQVINTLRNTTISSYLAKDIFCSGVWNPTITITNPMLGSIAMVPA
jgi:hypothetical protein